MAGRYALSSQQGAPPEALKARVEAALGHRWVGWETPQTGLMPAHRFIATLEGGGRVFVKAATTAETAGWLRNEQLALAAAPRTCAPEIIAWIDDELPILIIESLKDAYWPVQQGGTVWRAGDLERVFAALATLAATPAPATLPAMASLSAKDALGRRSTHNWRSLLAAPDGFVGLRLCSAAWLGAHGEALAQAEATLDLTGDSFVHGDIRSDNICLMDDRVVFVDWGQAVRGAPETDLAIFLPTAHLEGGPAPYAVMPDGAAWAAQQSGELARRAINDTEAPDWLRGVFRRLARINLDWAIASLGLPARAA